MIIGVLNQKGGVGKTTIAINLATHYALAGLRVLLIDADPQASSQAWSSARDLDPLFPVMGMAKPTLHRDLPAVASNYDVTIIDGAPRVSELARAAIIASDLVLMPVAPSPLDIWAAAETVKLIRDAQIYKPELRGAFVINRRVAGTKVGKDVREALAQFDDMTLLEPMLHTRIIYAETIGYGLAVMETLPGGAAATEIAALANSLMIKEERKVA